MLRARGNVDVLDTIAKLREDRCGLVQHAVQYSWLHSALHEYARRHMRVLRTAGKKAPSPTLPAGEALHQMLIEDRAAAATRRGADSDGINHNAPLELDDLVE